MDEERKELLGRLKEAMDVIRTLSIENLELRMRMREIEALVDGTEGRTQLAAARFDLALTSVKKEGL